MNSKTKFFSGVTDLQTLKKEYKRLALLHHPDRGGDTATMQQINNEYEYLSKVLVNADPTTTTEQKEQQHSENTAFIEILDKLINLVGLEIEICGSWLWITGQTYFNREALKSAGCKFSHPKQAWYYHSGEFKKYNGNALELDEIRNLYGSERVTNKFQNALI